MPVLYIDDESLFECTWEVVVHFNDLWLGSSIHTEDDFTDIIVYINGIPNPVSIKQFAYNADFNCVNLVYLNGSILDIISAGFAQYPATYQVSLKIHGIEFSKDETIGINVNADRTWDWIEPDIITD